MRAESITGIISRNYYFALLLLIALIIGVFGLLRREANIRIDSAAVVDVAGRQRMLSQKILFNAYRAFTTGAHALEKIQRELEMDIAMMEAAHRALVQPLDDMDQNATATERLHALYFQGERSLDQMVVDFLRLTTNVATMDESLPGVRGRLYAELILYDNDRLLEMLEEAVDLYLLKAQHDHERMHLLEALSMALILLVVVLLSVFVFRPMVQEVREKTLRILESERQRTVITDTMGEGVLVTDADLQVSFANAEAIRLLKYSYSDFMGVLVREVFVPRADPEEEDPFTIAKLDQRPVRSERATMVNHHGEEFPASVSVSPILADRVVRGLVVTFHDTTEQRAAESQLRMAKEEAEQANFTKEQFMSLIAHDLRGPMASLRQLLMHLEADETTLSEKQRHSLSLCVNSTSQMGMMIEELLDIQRIKSALANPQRIEVNLWQVAARVCMALELQAQEKGITIENRIAKDRYIHVDEELYLRVIANLVGNAIKFSYPGQTVTIYQPIGEKNALCIEDHGMGVPDSMLPNLFNREIKTSTVGSGGEAGTGLGLPLCYDIIKGHGGEIEVFSMPGGGSRFTVKIEEISGSAARPV